jgi:4-methyl-5(b-hydroxyethyl)-thiazole monophosphate biosynthesis
MILPDGFEEIEAVAAIDILRRGGVKVNLAALDFKLVDGGHDIMIKADSLIDTLPDYEFNMLILPGGGKGVENMLESEAVTTLIKRFDAEGKWIAAICAAPKVLEHAGILKGKKITCYPGIRNEIKTAHHIDADVVVDHNIITSRGPATAIAFGLKLLETLRPDHYEEVHRALLVPPVHVI